jgi:hypothetical protein
MILKVAHNHQTLDPRGEVVYGSAVWAPRQREGVEDFCGSNTEYQFRLRFQDTAFYGGQYTVYTLPDVSEDNLHTWAGDHDVDLERVGLEQVYARQDRSGRGPVPVAEMWCPLDKGCGKYKDEAHRLEREAVELRELDLGQVQAALTSIAEDSVAALREVPYVQMDDIAHLREVQDRPAEPPF